MKLNILIATVIDRRKMFDILLTEFKRQIFEYELERDVSVLYLEDNKEISVGLKRQRLLEIATADYIVYFDSDDFPAADYVKQIIAAVETKPDCVGFKIAMTTNGAHKQTCCHSLKYKQWKTNFDGFDYVRNVTHFNPVKRHLALQVGFKDLRFGEDKDYSDRLTKLCRTESYIDQFLFNYRYSTKEKYNDKYGIQ